MPRRKATTAGDVAVTGDAGVVNTGWIEQHFQVTINVAAESLDRLSELLRSPGGVVRLTGDHGAVEGVAEGSAALPLPANLLEAWRFLPRAPDADPRLRARAYAGWLVTQRPDRPSQLVAARDLYVPLAGRMSRDAAELSLSFSELKWSGEGPQRRLEPVPLKDVADAVGEHPAFVLLGAAGSGKSTVLWRLALDAARDYLVGSGKALPLVFTLAEYGAGQSSPLDFVSRRWALEAPGDFVTMVRAGQVLLLADGWNEMGGLAGDAERRRRANDWQRFVETHFADKSSTSRAVFASRDAADYAEAIGVPRVTIDPLDDAQVRRFLQLRLGDDAAAERAMEAIARLGLGEQAKRPYDLYIMAALYNPATGDLPPNRGRLFAAYARSLVEREGRVGHPHWIDAEAQLAALGELSFAVQEDGMGTVVPREDILKRIPTEVILPERPGPIPTPAERIFDLARRADLVVHDPAAERPDSFKFNHQLLQEQFAARALLVRWGRGGGLAALWRTPRTHREMPTPTGDRWDPLPAPPPSRWEQTTILAAGITDKPDSFLRSVLAANPGLAGRCLTEGAAEADAATRTAIQQALLRDLGDRTLHRRARIQAGHALGAVGDPRFEPVEIDGVAVILPPLVFVPGGRAAIGRPRWPLDRQAYADERPKHSVEVAPFCLARYPVTNAEYACFIAAGGYDRPDLWTPDGWRWRQGELAVLGPVEGVLQLRRLYLADPKQWLRDSKDLLMPENRDYMQHLMSITEDDARRELALAYSIRPHTEPEYWDDSAYHGQNQPVIGVTWFEAMAYSAWLGEMARLGLEARHPDAIAWLTAAGAPIQTDATVQRQVRLPNEVQWEWAAGGPRHHQYPWGGTWDDDKVNALDGRVLRTTPVGAFPAGAAPCGAEDLCGNIWEWTRSLYAPYPYGADDGREDERADGRRTLRGGSWLDVRRDVRVSFRSGLDPGNYVTFVGFRIVVAPV